MMTLPEQLSNLPEAIKELPTVLAGHTDNIKILTPDLMVSVSRVTKADGYYGPPITVEYQGKPVSIKHRAVKDALRGAEHVFIRSNSHPTTGASRLTVSNGKQVKTVPYDYGYSRAEQYRAAVKAWSQHHNKTCLVIYTVRYLEGFGEEN